YWLDRKDIQTGSTWTKEMEQALEETTIMILVLSKKAIESDFIHIEYMDFLRREKPIFWIKIEDCRTPRLLELIQGIEYSVSRTKQHNKLMTDLKAEMKRQQ